MKVVLVNGSPNMQGCTYTALSEVAVTLNKEGIETQIFQLGKKPVSGCMACQKCSQLKRCIINDSVNEFSELAATADGFVFGSPVYFASASGSITSFMDRAFYSQRSKYRLKPAAAVVSARRAGTTAALDQLNKYFTISQMPVISSSYWNMVHGFTPDDVRRDLEGLQVMRNLGRNMAWFLKCKEAAAAAGVPLPEKEPQIMTNFHSVQ
ncbi:flavodoxin family protein [Desulfovibrio sp. OttesenSCG-928-G15]|nr:flavodoxin family protein [Desulfovibrio sp. OttesenSCG-928-G15]